MNKYLLVAFVVLAIVMLILVSRRESFTTETDVAIRLNKLETSDKKVDERLALVEKQLKTAQEEQEKGEAQVNASIGNIQAVT